MTRPLLVLLFIHAVFQAPTADTRRPAARRLADARAPQTPTNAAPAAPQAPGNASPLAPPAGNQSPGNATPGNASPGNVSPGNASPGGPPSLDPAAAVFTTAAGMILVTVKPDKTADYEAVIVALQEALAKAEDEATRTLASGWRVLKSSDLDAKANVIYIHLLDPAIAETDYRPSLWLDKLLEGAPAELLSKYRDAFAAPPTKLPLVEFANMSVVPVAKPANASPDAPAAPVKPGNGSPDTPTAPAKPGNASPAAPGKNRSSFT